MKRIFLIPGFFLAGITASLAQSVGINSNGAQPNGSAILDVSSTTKGLLIPRMTIAQRTAIASPATGLQVYQTDSTKGLYYYNGGSWMQVGTVNNYSAGTGISISGATLSAKNTTALWNANQLQGKAVSAAAPSNGQVLQYNVTSDSWTPATSGTISSNGWGLKGNAATKAGSFIGTTDSMPFVGKANGTQVFRFSPVTSSTMLGYQAGKADTSGGDKNHFIGYQAGYYNTSFNNHFDGYRAGFNNTAGYSNQFIGFQSGYSNTTGTNNLFIGTLAGYSNTTQSNSHFIGVGAGFANTTGANNHFTGYDAGQANTTGSNNHFDGNHTGFSNTTGSNNFFQGYQAGYSNTTGNANYFSGNNAGFYSTTGISNHFSGSNAGYKNTTGSFNSFSGYHAGLSNTTGNENVAVGAQSLNNNISGNSNVAAGMGAMFNNVSGNSNVAAGSRASFLNTFASNTVAIGDYALYNNGAVNYDGIGSQMNVAIGSNALYSNTYGYDNTATGTFSSYSNQYGSNNTSYGGYSNFQGQGNNNTAIGYFSLGLCYGGNNNTAVGNNSLLKQTIGYFNTGVGDNANVADGAHNSTAIGADAYAQASNEIVLGSSTVTQIGGYSNWTTLSDGRFKKNIRENVSGLDFIKQLRPVTYTLDITKIDAFSQKDAQDTKSKMPLNVKTGKTDPTQAWAAKKIKDASVANAESIVYSGFVAQEVEAAANKTGYNFSGVKKPQNDKDHYRLSYSDFVVPLVKAVQEQQQLIEDLKSKNIKQQIENEQLKKDIIAIKAKLGL